MTDTSKYIAFRCPTKLYEDILEKQKNMSKFIKDAIKSYKDKDFRDNIVNGYTQYSKLFHSIEKYITKHKNMPTLEKFVGMTKKHISNRTIINEVEKVLL